MKTKGKRVFASSLVEREKKVIAEEIINGILESMFASMKQSSPTRSFESQNSTITNFMKNASPFSPVLSQSEFDEVKVNDHPKRILSQEFVKIKPVMSLRSSSLPHTISLFDRPQNLSFEFIRTKLCQLSGLIGCLSMHVSLQLQSNQIFVGVCLQTQPGCATFTTC